jgi:hypothetical protein
MVCFVIVMFIEYIGERRAWMFIVYESKNKLRKNNPAQTESPRPP